MNPYPIVAAVLIAGGFAAPALGQGSAGGASKIATVNGKAIPKSRLDTIVKQQTAQGTKDSEQLRRAITENLVNVEVVVQEADRKGLTKTAEFQMQFELARQQMIFQAYMQDHFKSHPIDEKAARAEYARVKAQRGDKEYKARHILVEKDTDAKEIIEQLKKGSKFEDLAKQSKDAGSRDRGGELEWQPASTYVKPFADALTRLEKGKTTEAPVQSPFGFHVIRLDDVRPLQFPAFDDVKQQIFGMLQKQEVDRVVKELRGKAKIVE